MPARTKHFDFETESRNFSIFMLIVGTIAFFAWLVLTAPAVEAQDWTTDQTFALVSSVGIGENPFVDTWSAYNTFDSNLLSLPPSAPPCAWSSFEDFHQEGMPEEIQMTMEEFSAECE